MDSFLNTDPSLLNIERVEVLRGSQSVMYGKSSMGGVINIISKKPTNEKRYTAYASAGNNWTRELGLLASGPIVEDRIFYTISGQYDGTEGFMENSDDDESNSKDTGRFKGQLRLTPTSRLDMTLVAKSWPSPKPECRSSIIITSPQIDIRVSPKTSTILVQNAQKEKALAKKSS